MPQPLYFPCMFWQFIIVAVLSACLITFLTPLQHWLSKSIYTSSDQLSCSYEVPCALTSKQENVGRAVCSHSLRGKSLLRIIKPFFAMPHHKRTTKSQTSLPSLLCFECSALASCTLPGTQGGKSALAQRSRAGHHWSTHSYNMHDVDCVAEKEVYLMKDMS